MERQNLSEASRRQLAQWLRRRLEGNECASLVSDDELIRHYFENKEAKQNAIAEKSKSAKQKA